MKGSVSYIFVILVNSWTWHEPDKLKEELQWFSADSQKIPLDAQN